MDVVWLLYGNGMDLVCSWEGNGRIGNAGKVISPGLVLVWGRKSGVTLAGIEQEGCHVIYEGKKEQDKREKGKREGKGRVWTQYRFPLHASLLF